MKATSRRHSQRMLPPDYDFVSLVERNVDGILVIDPLGHILFANRSAAKMLGRTQEELEGQLFGVPICPGELTEIELHAKQGGRRFVEMRLVDFVWEEKSAMLATLRDITARKRAQEAANEAVRRRDQFLAMLSHELRNPVGAISNAARVIEQAQYNRELTLDAAQVISRQAQQMGRLLDDLLDVTRVTRGQIELQPETVDVASIARDAVESAGPVVRAQGHQLEVNCPDGVYFVHGDPARLRQVIDNLLTNAAKYTPEGGQIELQVEGTENEMLIHVTDTGIGIPEDIRRRIFDLFVQADESLERAQGGLGIGLTLVRMLVQMHKGRVSVSDREAGRGSRFTVCLPRIAAPDDLVESQPRSDVTRRPLKVLLVDDNADARGMLESFLELNGYEIATAADGKEAVAVILRDRPDAAIVDIGLPKLNGYEVARQIRENIDAATTRLIALTGYGQATDRQQALEAGFDEHLVKPVDIDQLLEALVRPAEPEE